MRLPLIVVVALVAGCTNVENGGQDEVLRQTPGIATPPGADLPSIPTLTNESWPDFARVIESLVVEFRNLSFGDSDLDAQAHRYASEAPHDLAQGFPQAGADAMRTAWTIAYEDEWRARGLRIEDVMEHNDAERRRVLDNIRAMPDSPCSTRAAGFIHAAMAQHGVANQSLANGDLESAWDNEAGVAGAIHVGRRFSREECAPDVIAPAVQAWVQRELEKKTPPARDTQERQMADLLQWYADWAAEEGLPLARASAFTGRLSWYLASEANNGTRRTPTPEEVAAVAEVARAKNLTGFEALSYGSGSYWYANWLRHGNRAADPGALMLAQYSFALATGDPGKYIT